MSNVDDTPTGGYGELPELDPALTGLTYDAVSEAADESVRAVVKGFEEKVELTGFDGVYPINSSTELFTAITEHYCNYYYVVAPRGERGYSYFTALDAEEVWAMSTSVTHLMRTQPDGGWGEGDDYVMVIPADCNWYVGIRGGSAKFYPTAAD
jgi:hypothetical protein